MLLKRSDTGWGSLQGLVASSSSSSSSGSSFSGGSMEPTIEALESTLRTLVPFLFDPQSGTKLSSVRQVWESIWGRMVSPLCPLFVPSPPVHLDVRPDRRTPRTPHGGPNGTLSSSRPTEFRPGRAEQGESGLFRYPLVLFLPPSEKRGPHWEGEEKNVEGWVEEGCFLLFLLDRSGTGKVGGVEWGGRAGGEEVGG